MRSPLLPAALLATLLATPAWGADLDPERVAAQAATVFQEHCASVEADQVQEAADAIAAVNEAWRLVGEAFAERRVAYLMYWRGLLGQCLGQEERALADLRAFESGVSDPAAYATQLQDARRRIARLERRLGLTAGLPPGAGVGIGLAIGGGTTGALAGWQHGVAHEARQDWYSGDLLTAEFSDAEQRLRRAEGARTAFVISSAGLGAGAVMAWVITAATGRPRARAALDGPRFAVLPQPGGARVELGGRW